MGKVPSTGSGGEVPVVTDPTGEPVYSDDPTDGSGRRWIG